MASTAAQDLLVDDTVILVADLIHRVYPIEAPPPEALQAFAALLEDLERIFDTMTSGECRKLMRLRKRQKLGERGPGGPVRGITGGYSKANFEKISATLRGHVQSANVSVVGAGRMVRGPSDVPRKGSARG